MASLQFVPPLTGMISSLCMDQVDHHIQSKYQLDGENMNISVNSRMNMEGIFIIWSRDYLNTITSKLKG